MTVKDYAITYLDKEVTIIENSERRNVFPELSVFEKAVIYKYCEDGFLDLNESLRVGKEINLFGLFLQEALDKLPNFVGTVYRGVNLSTKESQHYLIAYLNDDIITESFFVSTSRSPLIGHQFGEIHFEIFSQRGKPVELLAKYPVEKEIVFLCNTKFRVINFEENQGNSLIQLIEI